MYVEAMRLSTYALKGRGNRRLIKSWRTLIFGCDKTHEVIRFHEQLSKTDQIILTSPLFNKIMHKRWDIHPSFPVCCRGCPKWLCDKSESMTDHRRRRSNCVL